MINKIDIASRNWAEDYITQHGRRFNNMLRESFIAGFQKGVFLSTESSKWIDQDEGAFFPVECLRCHKEPLLDEYGNYVYSVFCPSCGARMI